MTLNAEIFDVLYDLREHGAEAPFFLEAKLGNLALEWLTNEKYVRRLEATPAGTLVLLGPRGRQVCGLSPNYLSPPDIAADQYLRRRCLAALRSRGWTYKARVKQLKNVLELEHRDGRRAYLFARWKRPSARSVRRVLTVLRGSLVKGNAVLLVRTDLPHTLRHLSDISGGKVKSMASELYKGAD